MNQFHAKVIYDGDCNFCLGAMEFIRRHDRTGRFRCFTQDSPEAAPLLEAGGSDCETLHLFDDDGHHERSTAVLRIARGLGPPWSAMWLLHFVPRRLRDAVYDSIARRRRRCIAVRGPKS